MKIVLIGTGNLAMHLGPALRASGHEILQIVGRTKLNTQKLAKKTASDFTVNPNLMNNKADVYIICVRDEAIPYYTKFIPATEKLVLHTSGSVDIKQLSKTSPDFGVLYPLQTFSINRKINFKKVPLCLEASSAKARKKLEQLSLPLGSGIRWLDSKQRKIVHLAAVFANNFSNHLYVIAEELLKKEGIDFELIRPLIAESAAKVMEGSPNEMQTGPARRGDTSTIEKHLALLKNKKQFSKIYEVLTNSILDHNGPLL